MASYQIFRLKDPVRQNFRWTPHLSGLSQVKPKDYEAEDTVEGESLYAVWASLRGTPQELQIGDVIAIDTDDLRIVKYVGFEQAKWIVPEDKPAAGPVAVGAGA
ncbi:MAG: hypothetical protein ABI823_06210 [Bryobacteraceae bacterium]